MGIPDEVKKLVDLALAEDIGRGDITTEAVFRKETEVSGQFIAKESGTIAGLDIAKFIFHKLNPDIRFGNRFNNGDRVEKGEVIAQVSGPANTVLTGERTVLNFMQRMSGIATKTRKFVDAVSHTNCRILDTRKTIPGHRYLDKLAVRLGGGKNHRARLDDMFLIKENHIITAGGIPQAISSCNRYAKENALQAEIEIEVRTMDELDQVLEHGNVRYILLDNMPPAMLRKAVERIDKQYLTEASGNVTLKTAGEIAGSGVDFVSVGELTHSVEALDISLVFN